MITIVQSVSDSLGVQRVVQECVRVLDSGGVIVYPTDTVYGLGVDATNGDAVALVRKIKRNDATKPILAMVSDGVELSRYAQVTPLARTLVNEFLPGPLSIVLEGKGEGLKPVCSSDGSLGFRMPDHIFCLTLARAFGRPITSTSVNRSGMAQPYAISTMLAQLGDEANHISLVVDMGPTVKHTPSTIVDARGTSVRIVREGEILRDRFVGFAV